MKKILVISGPSGVGKTYLAAQLLSKYPDNFTEAKLYTTRQQRDGEQIADRIFVSEAKFKDMQENGKFAITGIFHDNWYGYSNDALKLSSSNTIINTWPAMLDKFLLLDTTIILGLSVSAINIEMLEKRMHMRGDARQKILERIPLIKKDIADLEQATACFRKQDKLFIIEDDTTLQKTVLPWVKSTFKL